MADLVHLTLEHDARRIARSGLSARSRGWFGDFGVYCMPVLPSFTLTYQWVRELRRWKPGVHAALHLRIPDDEPVTVGRYGREPARVSAAQAVATVRAAEDPRGFEVFLPRSVPPAEIRAVRQLPQRIGWRFMPNAHGTLPCTCPACATPGRPGAAKLRRRRPYDPPPRTKPQIMASLLAATTSDEIIDALWELGRRSRGGVEELYYLAEHPDPEVREVLAAALKAYRGTAAKALREQVLAGLPPDPDDLPDDEQFEL